MQPIQQPPQSASASSLSLPNEFHKIAGGAQKSIQVQAPSGEIKTFIITISKSGLNDAQFENLLQTYDAAKSANVAELALAMNLSEGWENATLKPSSFEMKSGKIETPIANVGQHFAKNITIRGELNPPLSSLAHGQLDAIQSYQQTKTATKDQPRAQGSLAHQAHVQEIKNIAANTNGDLGPLVCFHETGPTSFLGNFHDCSPTRITLGNMNFKSAEGAYHYLKFTHTYVELKQARDKALAHRIDSTTIENQLAIFEDFDKNHFFTATGEEANALNAELSKQGFKVAKSWDEDPEARNTYMWLILCAKFKDPNLKELLKATGKAYLLAHSVDSQSDAYWTDQYRGTGQNMLGKMLMVLRDLPEGTNPSKVDIKQLLEQVHKGQEAVERYASHANQG